jgi:hypothetical protein
VSCGSIHQPTAVCTAGSLAWDVPLVGGWAGRRGGELREGLPAAKGTPMSSCLVSYLHLHLYRPRSTHQLLPLVTTARRWTRQSPTGRSPPPPQWACPQRAGCCGRLPQGCGAQGRRTRWCPLQTTGGGWGGGTLTLRTLLLSNRRQHTRGRSTHGSTHGGKALQSPWYPPMDTKAPRRAHSYPHSHTYSHTPRHSRSHSHSHTRRRTLDKCPPPLALT